MTYVAARTNDDGERRIAAVVSIALGGSAQARACGMQPHDSYAIHPPPASHKPALPSFVASRFAPCRRWINLAVAKACHR